MNQTQADQTPGTSGLISEEPIIFEMGSPGRKAYSLPPCDVPEVEIETLLPPAEIRQAIEKLPELTELDVVRHYTRLSQWNFSIDTNFYPLGSCTMKYNPKINETLARLPGFAQHHPMTPDADSQGSLQLMYELQECLKTISGMDHASLHPAAGAQGEFTGMLMIQAYHAAQGNPRKKVLLPDSAHGTNPASATLCGYKSVQLPSNSEGTIDVAKLEAAMDEETAAIMLTNPNTLGMFEKDILKITEIVHKKGGLVYCDGANLNAVMGIAKMGDMGIDVLHINLHKTFSTPHGGGGPGAGPVCIKDILEPYLPAPVVEKAGSKYRLNRDRPQSIGRLKSFNGNFGMLLRAYAYIRTLGPEGIREAARSAVLNANYIRARLKDTFHLPFTGPSLHECVFNDKGQGITTMDFAKALIDHGFHPPTVYFPLIVKGALMIEPTETESKETLDNFIAAMKSIAKKGKEDPESFHASPKLAKVSRPDEAQAARHPKLRWHQDT
ncbi:MAG: glycine dehydrogenase (aminomethyl-transferring) [Nitrospinae bacterium CG22_combo_CG10-13_8_21_14_all_47_10]|nr:MAG: glycine dehydrogenase (aminomethyl-transferring) [Nitrospinae bacterium CG22_combo_CG10-13_8_21_14_all_47_10]